MPEQGPLSDAELATVAAVAARERWADLARPPDAHGPRTLDEERAVARFAAAVPRRRGRGTALRVRLTMAALSVVVLGACWAMSPTRTALALLGAGAFSLVALRRGRRRERRARASALPGLR